MKNVFKRVMAAMLSLIMVMSLAACGAPADDKTTDAPKATDAPSTNAPDDKGTEASTDAAEFDPKTITDGVTLTIAVKADDEVIDWETNLVTKMVEEKFGVDLQFEVYASDGFGDKLNVMINGGDKLPDIIFGDSTKGLNDFQTNWVDAGAILELTEFYENPDYASNINAEMEKLGVDVVSMLEDADGKIWSLPKYFTALNDACAHKLWINAEYAKAVGYDEIPTTTEGFFELCKAFAAAGDVNGNGLDDELAFTGRGDNLRWFLYLMSPFAYAWDDHVLDVENGKLSFAYATDGWKEGLKYIKQFFDEGIIDTTVLTQDKAGYNAIVNNSEAVVLADVYYRPQMVNSDVTLKTQTWLEYDFVAALEGPKGTTESYYSDLIAYPGAMITVDCENPEAAFIVLDYMCSEYISICNRYGEEGVDWDYWENVDSSKFADGTTKEMYLARNGEEPLFCYYSSKYWGTGTPQNAGYMQAGPNILYSDEVGLVLTGATTDEAKVQEDWMTLYQKESVNAVFDQKPEERIVRLPMTAEETTTVAEPQKVLDNYWKEAVGNFLTGEWDIDGYWDTYLAELEKMGMSDVLAIYQTSYDRTK
ncbi:MAG: hypothetical protein IJZ85_03245 [Lachnospiraceae bacterium]|nr:hypothetical protein [Lachnospiraceae bacterium]